MLAKCTSFSIMIGVCSSTPSPGTTLPFVVAGLTGASDSCKLLQNSAPRAPIRSALPVPLYLMALKRGRHTAPDDSPYIRETPSRVVALITGDGCQKRWERVER